MGLKNIRFYGGFPDHSFDKIITMIELGFGSWREIKVNGVKIAPAEFLTEVLKNIKETTEGKERIKGFQVIFSANRLQLLKITAGLTERLNVPI